MLHHIVSLAHTKNSAKILAPMHIFFRSRSVEKQKGTTADGSGSGTIVDRLISNGSAYGLILEQGVYVAGIQPGSLADKEGSISVGARIAKVGMMKLETTVRTYIVVVES